jgi:hypothetical protein
MRHSKGIKSQNIVNNRKEEINRRIKEIKEERRKG